MRIVIFKAAMFATSKNWKQPKCSLTEGSVVCSRNGVKEQTAAQEDVYKFQVSKE